MTAMYMPQGEPDDAVFLSMLFERRPTHLHTLIWMLPNKISRSFTDTGNLLADVLAYIRDQQEDNDIYIGVGMANKAVENAKRRFAANQVSALYGLWADVDILDENHKKTNLPETEEEALALVYSTGMTPTMVVNSGHGLHAWWLFEEPLLMTDKNRGEVEAFVFRWIDAMRRRARIKGWTIDATQDLARVLRVPGTTNHKDPEKPLPVTLRECRGVRYAGLEDFAASIDGAPIGIFDPKVKPTNVDDLALPDDVRKLARAIVISPDAEPPMSLWHALISQNPKAKQTFDHKRRDMQDDSLSEYDFSLAMAALRADEHWTDQQIVDLLISHRKKHAKDAKELKLRPDYYARTLLRAKTRVESEIAVRELGDILHGVGTPESATENGSPKVQTPTPVNGTPKHKPLTAEEWARQFSQGDAAPARKSAPEAPSASEESTDEEPTDEEPTDEEASTFDLGMPSTPLSSDARRSAMIHGLYGQDANLARMYNTLNTVFENQFFKVVRVVRMVSSPPMFAIVIRMNFTGEVLNIHLGDISGIMSQRQFIQSVAAYAGVVIASRKQKDWEKVVATMLLVAENEEIGEEATEAGMMSAWLDGFIDRYLINRDWAGEDGRGEPPSMGAFTYNGQVCFAGTGLLYWLRTDSMERVSPQNLGKMLRALEANTVSVPFYRSGIRTTRTVWALSPSMSKRYLSVVYAMDGTISDTTPQE